MNLLVAGGAGFIGSRLVRRLIKDGHRVICLDSLITGRKENLEDLGGDNFSFIRADITKPFKIEEDLDGIFHLGSPASPVDFDPLALQILDANSLGTRNLLDLAREKGAVFLMASTSEVYGDPAVHPQPEDYRGNVNTTGPRSTYDESKRFAETLTYIYRQKFGINTRTARIFNTYGPAMRADDGRVIPNFITAALSGKPLTIYGDGKQTRSFCYVDDLVDGLIRLFNSDFTSPVNLGNPCEYTILEAAEVIISLCSSSSVLEYIGLPPDDPRRRCPDISRAKRELGWEPEVCLEDGLLKTIAWFAGTEGRDR